MLLRTLTAWLLLVVSTTSLTCPVLAQESPSEGKPTSRPNVLLIVVDDLNDWVGCLGGHPQARTPNLDKLATSGTLFTNAHTPGSSGNPARTAILTGRSPHRSGVYDARVPLRLALPTAEIMPQTFARHGYRTAGAGKVLYYQVERSSWQQYFPNDQSENPLPPMRYPAQRPINLPHGGDWQYVETDWGPLDVTDEEFGGDTLVAEWVAQQLRTKSEQPFFLACGFYRPHEPWYVPRKYFEQFPLETIQLPPGYRENDLSDLPAAGQSRGPNRYLAHIQQHQQWKKAIQGYLASIAYMDAQLGKVLDALETGPHAQKTIVVLCSDNGFHLGEKEHWQKYTAWRQVSRVPLIVRVPEGATPQQALRTNGSQSQRSVSLLSIFPTLLELCGLPAEPEHDGPSLLPLLRDPRSAWPHAAVTSLNTPGSFGLTYGNWRYLHYSSGEEELYDTFTDPHEWTNLARQPGVQKQLEELRKLAPTSFAPNPGLAAQAAPTRTAAIDPAPAQPANALGQLRWIGGATPLAPPARPRGEPHPLQMTNRSPQAIKLFTLDAGRQPKFASIIRTGQTYRAESRAGEVWQVTDGYGFQIGYFLMEDHPAQAIIPPDAQQRTATPASSPQFRR